MFFSTPNTTRRLFSTKDRLPVESLTHAVYSLSCKTCKEEYIGETLRAVKVRCKEHRDAMRLSHTPKSVVAEHVHCQDEVLEIEWENVRVIDDAKRKWKRKIREAMQIQKRKPRMNRDRRIEGSDTWSALVSSR